MPKLKLLVYSFCVTLFLKKTYQHKNAFITLYAFFLGNFLGFKLKIEEFIKNIPYTNKIAKNI